jgi:hypothetical protein
MSVSDSLGKATPYFEGKSSGSTSPSGDVSTPRVVAQRLQLEFPATQDIAATRLQKAWHQNRFIQLKKETSQASLAFSALGIGNKPTSQLDSLNERLLAMEALGKEQETLKADLIAVSEERSLNEGFEHLAHQLSSKDTLVKAQRFLKTVHKLTRNFQTEGSRDFKLPLHDKPTKTFLMAFMYAKYPNVVTEAPTDATRSMLSYAKELVHHYKALGKELMKPVDDQKGARYYTALKNFYHSWAHYIHHFKKHTIGDRANLRDALIAQYIKIYTERERIRFSTKPIHRELFIAESNQLENLKKHIEELDGTDGLQELEDQMAANKTIRDSSVLMRLSEERFLHQIATDPNFKLDMKGDQAALERAIKKACDALKDKPANHTPLIELFENLSQRICDITPHRLDIAEAIKSQVSSVITPLKEESASLNEEALLDTVQFLLAHLKNLSNSELEGEIDTWQQSSIQRLVEGTPILELLPEAIKTLTLTTQKISIELINFQTTTFRDAFVQRAAEKEKILFKERLDEFEITLDKTWVVMKEGMKKNPGEIHNERFFTRQGPRYLVASAMTRLLSLSNANFNDLCPETLLLDMESLNQARKEYHNLRLCQFSLALSLSTLPDLNETELKTLQFSIMESLKEKILRKDKFLETIEISIKANALKRGHPNPDPLWKPIKKMLTNAYENPEKILAPLDKSLGKALFTQLTTGSLPLSYSNKKIFKLIEKDFLAISERLHPILLFNETIHGDLYKEIIQDSTFDDYIDLVFDDELEELDDCPPQYEASATMLMKSQATLQNILSFATGLSMIKSQIVSSELWDYSYLVDEDRLEEIVEESGLFGPEYETLSDADFFAQFADCVQQEVNRFNKTEELSLADELSLAEEILHEKSDATSTGPLPIEKMQQQALRSWSKFTSQTSDHASVKTTLSKCEVLPQLNEHTPLYGSYWGNLVCQKIWGMPLEEYKTGEDYVRRADFEKNKKAVRLAIALTHGWHHVSKTCTRKKSHVEFDDEEIAELVSRFDLNSLVNSGRCDPSTIQENLTALYQRVLEKRPEITIRNPQFIRQLSRLSVSSHPGKSAYQENLKRALRKALKNPSMVLSVENLPKKAKKMMLQFFSSPLQATLKDLVYSYNRCVGSSLFKKEDSALLTLPKTLRSGLK